MLKWQGYIGFPYEEMRFVGDYIILTNVYCAFIEPYHALITDCMGINTGDIDGLYIYYCFGMWSTRYSQKFNYHEFIEAYHLLINIDR